MKLIVLLISCCCLIFSCLTDSRPPKDVHVEAPISQSSVVDPKDSSVLHILINKIDFDVYYLKDTLRKINSNKLDTYIAAIKQNITNQDKIIVKEANKSDSLWKKLKEILKKHSIYKFRIATTN